VRSRCLLIASSLAPLVACNAPDVDRIVIRQGDEVAQVSEGSGGRRAAPIELRGRGSDVVVTTGVGFTHLATIAAPVWQGTTLQATDVQWNGHTVVASYMVRGPQQVGAIQVIDAAAPSRPRVVAEAIFPHTDITRVVVSGSSILATALDDQLGATLELLRYERNELRHDRSQPLGSRAGTYVSLDGYHAYVSAGDAGGGVRVFDLAGDAPVLLRSLAVADARWVDQVDGDAVVVSGSPAQVTRYRDVLTGGTRSDGVGVPGGSVGAPTWASRDNDILFLSADEGGLQVYDLDTLTPLAAVAVGGNANGSTLTNDRRLLFMANGDAGLAVADVTDVAAPRVLATIDMSDDAGSANSVVVHGSHVALADGLGGVKLFKYDRSQKAPNGDSDGDGDRDDRDTDDDDDGVLDRDDAAPTDPDLVCGDEQLAYSGHFVGDFFNLPCDHPDVEGPITGVVTGHQPGDYDWYSSRYYAFTIEREDLLIPYARDYFPVNQGVCGDPYYFAAHWYTTAIASKTGTYTFSLGSDDDGWLLIDDRMVIDLGGIHAANRRTGSIRLTEGPHRIDIYFAERHRVQSALEFEVTGMPSGARLDTTQHLCLDRAGDADGDGVRNADDLAPLRRPGLD